MTHALFARYATGVDQDEIMRVLRAFESAGLDLRRCDRGWPVTLRRLVTRPHASIGAKGAADIRLTGNLLGGSVVHFTTDGHTEVADSGG